MCRSEPAFTQYSFAEFTSKILGHVFVSQASAQAAVGLAGDRIEKDLIRKRELALRIPSADVLTVGSCSLCKSIVEKDSASAAEPVEDAIEDAVPLLVLVEAQMQEVAHVAGGLRNAKRVDGVNASCERVGRASVVALRVPQKRGEVPRGGEAQAGDGRILRRVGELVKPALREWGPDGHQSDRLAVDVLPAAARDGHRRIGVAHSHGEAGLRLVHGR